LALSADHSTETSISKRAGILSDANGVLSKYSNCLKSLAEVIGLANDNLGADLERSLPILRSCYFIADSVDLVHILVTEKSDPTKTARNRPNLGIRHPHVDTLGFGFV